MDCGTHRRGWARFCFSRMDHFVVGCVEWRIAHREIETWRELVELMAIIADGSPLLAKFVKWNEQVFRIRLHNSNPLVELVQLHILLRRAHVVLIDILDCIRLDFVFLGRTLTSCHEPPVRVHSTAKQRVDATASRSTASISGHAWGFEAVHIHIKADGFSFRSGPFMCGCS